MVHRSDLPPPLTLIAETRPSLAEGLRVFLTKVHGLKPMTIMTGFDHVVEHAERHDTALIIVGEGMNGVSPLNELRRLRERNSIWRLALLTDATDRKAIMAGLAAGASGVLPTSIEEPELHAAVTGILAGNVYVPGPSSLIRRGAPISGVEGAPPVKLTPRQFEVLKVLSRGYTNTKIGEFLRISNSTVSMHLHDIFEALGVHDRESAALAFLMNMVSSI